MNKIYTTIKLTNELDISRAEQYLIAPKEIRAINVAAIVNSKSDLLVINEAIQQQLGLKKQGQKLAKTDDGSVNYYDIVGPVKLEVLGNRMAITTAIVIPQATEILLGAIPLRELDVQIDELKGALILPPDRLDYALMSVK